MTALIAYAAYGVSWVLVTCLLVGVFALVAYWVYVLAEATYGNKWGRIKRFFGIITHDFSEWQVHYKTNYGHYSLVEEIRHCHTCSFCESRRKKVWK